MDKLVINGGKPLFGCMEVSCAKNAFLPILAGSILCEGEVVLHKVPNFEDITSMCNILGTLGIKKQISNDDLFLNCRNADSWEIPEKQTKPIRSSIFCLGAMLGRFKKAKISFPGGCAIGLRPIDLHIKGLRALNVKIEENDGFLNCDGSDMRSGDVFFDYPSVGATENVMLAATLTKGISRIFNPAREPEIEDLQNFLNAAGAKISGAGGSIITIQGVQKLKSVTWTPIPDRIITGTFIIACAMTGGKIELRNTNAKHIESLIRKIDKKCCNISVLGDKIVVESNRHLMSFKSVETKPYPGFPTDLQPQIMALGCICSGNCSVTENLFETRFKHVPELLKMGANIITLKKTAHIIGKKHLKPAIVESSDLRGGACLVLAALATEGETTVTNIFHIDRGYEAIEDSFFALGGDIKRINDPTNEKNNNYC